MKIFWVEGEKPFLGEESCSQKKPICDFKVTNCNLAWKIKNSEISWPNLYSNWLYKRVKTSWTYSTKMFVFVLGLVYVQVKAVVLGATFLIDYMFYDHSGDNG